MSQQITNFPLKRVSLRVWFIWGIAAFYVLFQFFLQVSPSVMLPELEQSFHIDSTGIGWVSASFFYSYLICQIPAGFIVDKIGVRRTLLVAVGLCMIFTVLYALATSVLMASLFRFMTGIVVAPAFVSALYLGYRWFPVAMFPLIVGLTETFGMLGGALGQIVLAKTVILIGWRDSMIICAGLSLILMLLIYLFVCDAPDEFQNEHEDILMSKTSILRDLYTVIKLPQVWINGIYAGLLFALIQAFAGLWAVTFLKQIYSFSLGKAAFISSLIFWGSVFGAPFFGWLAEMIRRYRAIMIFNAVMALCLIMIIINVLTMNTFFIAIIFFLLGFFGASYMLPFSVIQQVTPANIHGTTMGMANMMCILIGAPILQPLIGVILNMETAKHVTPVNYEFTLDQYQYAFIPLVAALFLAIVLAIFVNPKKNKL